MGFISALISRKARVVSRIQGDRSVSEMERAKFRTSVRVLRRLDVLRACYHPLESFPLILNASLNRYNG